MSVARQLGKKFEQYKTRKTDSNMLLLHSLNKLVSEKALYDRYVKGLGDDERIEVTIPMEQFENEARDFNQHNINDFLKSSLFSKGFTIDGRHIKTIGRV